MENAHFGTLLRIKYIIFSRSTSTNLRKQPQKAGPSNPSSNSVASLTLDTEDSEVFVIPEIPETLMPQSKPEVCSWRLDIYCITTSCYYVYIYIS